MLCTSTHLPIFYSLLLPKRTEHLNAFSNFVHASESFRKFYAIILSCKRKKVKSYFIAMRFMIHQACPPVYCSLLTHTPLQSLAHFQCQADDRVLLRSAGFYLLAAHPDASERPNRSSITEFIFTSVLFSVYAAMAKADPEKNVNKQLPSRCLNGQIPLSESST